ncbi:PepSY-associated TM helix domain-containing protein [Halomonadaceae bacterium KBTZ08]
MAWLHTWSGLVVGWVLFFVFAMGSAGYFEDEITRWMKPELPLETPPSAFEQDALIDRALSRLTTVAPEATAWRVILPHHSRSPRGWADFGIQWRTPPENGEGRGARHSETLDPSTGQPVEPVSARETGGGSQLYRMHYALHYINTAIAYRIVGVCAMLMLVALITGVITHRKIFKDFFTFRPGKGQRSWLDAHNLISVMALPFFLMITYSGLAFFATTYLPAGIAVTYGTSEQAREAYFDDLLERGEGSAGPVARPEAPVAPMVAQAASDWGEGQVRAVRVRNPAQAGLTVGVERVRGSRLRFHNDVVRRFDGQTGERLPPAPGLNATAATTRTLFALHEGLFAGSMLRWLYFGSGLLGCGMIGTGLVLWTVKRRRQHATQGRGLQLVEALNVATIAGLPVAVAAYFWANRLLPVGMEARAAWEVHCLFLVWGEILIYACFRDTRRAWVDVLGLAAVAFILVPVINALTTNRHLGVTLPAGDWGLAGLDLTVLGLGSLFGVLAVKVRRRWLGVAAPIHGSGQAATGLGEAA